MSTDDSNRRRDAEPEPDASAGYREEYDHVHAPNAADVEESADPFQIAAMIRRDRPRRYREKHRNGVSS